MSRTRFRVNPHCLNVKELLTRNRRHIWSLSDCSWTQTHNNLVHKRTLNHFAKLAKWLSCVVSTYLYGAFDCMFLSCHVRMESLRNGWNNEISEWNSTDKYSQHCSIIWPVWLNGWAFVYELSGCGFESSCSYLNFLTWGKKEIFYFRKFHMNVGKNHLTLVSQST